jgi:hypothetical protein
MLNINVGDEKNCFEIQSCEKTVRKTFEISVPVTVTPFAVPEKPDVKCCGDIDVRHGHSRCESDGNKFEFTVTQRINIEIPIKFGAEVCLDKTCADEKTRCTESDEAYYSQ